MSNQDYFTTQDCVIAWREAKAEADVMFPSPAPPAPTVRRVQPVEPPPLRKPRVTEHVERTFVFSDGSECSACTATGCSWGIRPDGKVRGKRHSGDGVPVASELDAAQEILDLLTPEESSDEIPTDRQELIVGPVERAPVEAGVDDPEPELEQEESGEEIADESGLTEVEDE